MDNVIKVCAVIVTVSLVYLVFFGSVGSNTGQMQPVGQKSAGPFPMCDGPDFQTVVTTAATSNEKTRVLITGAAGFIGSHIAEFCAVKLKFDVVMVDDLSGGFERNMKPVVDVGGVFVKGDVQDDDFIKKVFAENGPFDYVYHIAAYAAEGLSHFIRRYNYGNNLVASTNLINAAVRQARELNRPVKRIVFTSSIAAYGSVLDASELPMTERTPQRPEDPYGIAKHSAELDLKTAKHFFGQDYTIFRPHNVYGPRQNIADKFRNAIGIFMNQILRNEPITIFGDGKQTRAFSYIDDVAPIIAASVLFPKAAGEDFFVGTDEPWSVNDLATVVAKAMKAPGHEIQHLPARKEVVDAYASHDKMRCFFKPPQATKLNDGVEITAAHVLKEGSYEPKGYLDIEINHDLPPSWREWLHKAKKNQ